MVVGLIGDVPHSDYLILRTVWKLSCCMNACMFLLQQNDLTTCSFAHLFDTDRSIFLQTASDGAESTWISRPLCGKIGMANKSFK